MDFSRPLLLKGLAGVAAVGTVGGIGISYGKDIGNLFMTKEKLEKMEKDKKDRKGVNEKLGSLGLEGDCLVKESEDPSAFPRECPLNLERLRKIKFSNKGEGDLKVSGEVPENLKIKIEGNKEDFSFYFLNIPATSPIAIVGEKGKIVLKSDRKFKEKEGKLEKDSSGVDGELKSKLEEFNKQLETVKAPVECRFDEEENEESFECPITEDELKGLEFSNKEDGNLTVKDWPSSDGVKLKVERNEKVDISLSFTGVTSDIKVFGEKTKRKIVIKNAADGIKKFKVENGKLTKDSTGVNTTLKSKLEEINKQLGTINVPLECRFDETESEDSVECDVSKEQLKKMVFSKDQGEVTYSSGEDFTGMKFKVQIIKTVGSDGNKEISDLFLAFKDYDRTVKLKKGEEEIVSLIKGTNPEFGIKIEDNNHSLTKELDPEGLLGLDCSDEDGGGQGNCKFTANGGEKKIKVAKGTEDEPVELTVTDENNKFKLHKDQENYNQGFKFEYSGTKVSASGSDVSLEPNSNYEFRWKHKEGEKVGYLVKKN